VECSSQVEVEVEEIKSQEIYYDREGAKMNYKKRPNKDIKNFKGNC